MDNFELYIDIIQRLNNRILLSNYALGQERETILLLKNTKEKLQKMMLNSNHASLCLISSLENNNPACGIIMHMPVVINGIKFDSFVDLETGKISIYNDGDLQESINYNNKTFKSEFIVERELDFYEIYEKTNIPYLNKDEGYEMLYIYNYLRNNQEAFANLVNKGYSR